VEVGRSLLSGNVSGVGIFLVCESQASGAANGEEGPTWCLHRLYIGCSIQPSLSVYIKKFDPKVFVLRNSIGFGSLG